MQDLPFSALVRFQINSKKDAADKMSQMLLKVVEGTNATRTGKNTSNTSLSERNNG